MAVVSASCLWCLLQQPELRREDWHCGAHPPARTCSHCVPPACCWGWTSSAQSGATPSPGHQTLPPYPPHLLVERGACLPTPTLLVYAVQTTWKNFHCPWYFFSFSFLDPLQSGFYPLHPAETTCQHYPWSPRHTGAQQMLVEGMNEWSSDSEDLTTEKSHVCVHMHTQTHAQRGRGREGEGKGERDLFLTPAVVKPPWPCFCERPRGPFYLRDWGTGSM